jgi:hypothetical protein
MLPNAKKQSESPQNGIFAVKNTLHNSRSGYFQGQPKILKK